MTSENGVEILLVEDNRRDGELTMRALNKRHLANRLVWVKDGDEALDYIFGTSAGPQRSACHAPKVILLDLKLPKVDGLEVLRRLKGDERTKNIPVVVVTSSREEQDIVESYRQIGIPVSREEARMLMASVRNTAQRLKRPLGAQDLMSLHEAISGLASCRLSAA